MSNPRQAQRWPNKALQAAEDVMAAMVDVGRRCDDLERAAQARSAALAEAARHAQAVDRLAARIADAVRNGNAVLAIRLTNELRDANAAARASEQTARDHTQDIRGHVQAIRHHSTGACETLAMARRGEYRE